MREVGILLFALAPLDFAFTELSLRTALLGLFFMSLGVLLFRDGLRREPDVDDE